MLVFVVDEKPQFPPGQPARVRNIAVFFNTTDASYFVERLPGVRNGRYGLDVLIVRKP